MATNFLNIRNRGLNLQPQATAPISPVKGDQYCDTDGNYHIYDGSSWKKIATGNASGRNYLSDWFDSSKTPVVVTLAGATANRTADQTSWRSSNTSDITIAANTSSTLREGKDYLINSLTSTASSFLESPMFSLDLADLGKALSVKFDITGVATSGNSDVAIVRYNSSGTYQEVISVAGNASSSSLFTPSSALLPTGTGKFQGFFISGATSTDKYALRIRKPSSGAADDDFQIDSLYVGPESVQYGTAITDWISYTPVLQTTGDVSDITSGVSAKTGKYRRVGDSIECHVTIQFNGTPAITGGRWKIGLPSGYVIDTTKYPNDLLSGQPVGEVRVRDNGGSQDYTAQVISLFSETSFVSMVNTQGTSAAISNTSPFTFSTSDGFSLTFTVPVVGASSNIQMADRAVEEYGSNSGTWDATDSTTFSYGASGSAIGGTLTADRTKRVRFSNIQPTDKFEVEFSDDRISWFPAGITSVNGNSVVNTINSAGTGASGF